MLKNALLEIAISSLGAELKSVKHKTYQLEYMWQADPQFWGRTSPVLFPIVGKLSNNCTQINGQAYQLSQHGFARDCEFECVAQTDDKVSFRLTANDQTKTKYPFNFELLISYILQADRLTVNWQVINPNTEILPFSIGAHPAFSTQLKNGDLFEDYDIIFDQLKNYYTWPFNAAMQLVNQGKSFKQRPVQKFPLDYADFFDDALVFPEQQLQAITLKNRHHGHGVSVEFAGFPEVALWTVDAKNKRSPFVCIEPWFGHADLANGSPEFINKRGVIQLASQERFEAEYQILFF